ncbi:ankyrin repeat domain-containing protein [Cardinium endosymbiont of Philonthus spinipes]|uniref:ankyrin repeat domain-containing protein n=1 Tax=Cardinium endosymbiont of Philonthus spinipes TaxID=3077941 RepID=UPI00313C3A15
MKYFNVNGKRSSLLAKGIAVLSLSVVLQGAEGCRGWNQRGAAYYVAMTPIETFPDKLKEKFEKGSTAIFKDKTGRSLLYVLVENKEDTKLLMFLKFYNDNKQDTNFKGNFKKALNAIDPKSQKTPIGISIEKGYEFGFDLLITQEGIHINKAGTPQGKNPTSILSALAHKQLKMVTKLLSTIAVDEINITVIDPISGNTVLHLAIENKWENIALEFINRLFNKQEYGLLSTKNKTNEDTALHLAVRHKQKAVQEKLIQCIEKVLDSQSPTHESFKDKSLEFLFAQNKDGKTALHSAMKYKQGYIQGKLIELALQHNQKEKLWIKDNKGRSAIDIGILYDQSNVPKLIKELPLEKIDQKLVHTIVSHNKEEAFKAILDRLSVLAKEDKDNVQGKLKELFGSPTAGKKSMWEYIYLSKLSTEPAITGTNIKMFKDAIEVIKSILPQKEWQDIEKVILNKIKEREVTPRIKGGISTQYATKLRNIIKSTSSVPSVPSRPLPDQKEAESTEHSTQLQKAQAG